MPEEQKASSKSYSVTVNKSPLDPPLLETQEASSIEIRGRDGELLFLMVLVPGFPVLFTSAADEGKDFQEFCKNMGFEVFKNK